MKKLAKPNKFLENKIISNLQANLIGEIHNENCLFTMQKMPDDFIDMVITSPPYDNIRSYGGNDLKEFEKIAQSLFRVLKKGGTIVWIVNDQSSNWNESGTSFKQALFFKDVGFNLLDTMIYLKSPRGAVGNNQCYWQSFEYMFVFTKGKPKTIHLICDRENKESRKGDTGTKRIFNGDLKKIKRNGYAKLGRRTNVWHYNIGKGHSASDNIAHKHPAIFPERLVADHLKSWSNENDLVYDPFMGSGTTAKVAESLKRKWIGSELNSEYCKIAYERLDLLKND